MSTFPAQDYILLATSGPPARLKRSPGRCWIRGAGTPRTWDIRQGYGIDSAQTIFTGNAPAKFSVDVFLWTDEHWNEWDEFAPILVKPTPATRNKALSIVHPILLRAPLNITSVVIEDVTQFEYNPSIDQWACEIKFLQFKKPRPILVKPTAAIPAAVQAPPTAKDAYEQKIEQLYTELGKL